MRNQTSIFKLMFSTTNSDRFMCDIDQIGYYSYIKRTKAKYVCARNSMTYFHVGHWWCLFFPKQTRSLLIIHTRTCTRYNNINTRHRARLPQCYFHIRFEIKSNSPCVCVCVCYSRETRRDFRYF